MKLPYIQVTAETWPKARELAAILEIPMGQAFMLLCDLWSWGLTLGPPDGPPTGEFTGSYAVARLAGAVNWTGDRALLKEALVQLDLITFTDEGLRVRGLGRYAEAWTKAQRSKDRIAKWREGQPIPAQTAPTRVPNAYRTRTERVRTPGDADADADADAVVPSELLKAPTPEKLPLEVRKPDKAPEAWTGDDFWQWAQWTRQKNGLLVERKRPHPSKLGGWFSTVLLTPGVTIEALKAGFGRFGQDRHWEGSDPPFPVAAFMAGWDKYTRAGELHANAS